MVKKYDVFMRWLTIRSDVLRRDLTYDMVNLERLSRLFRKIKVLAYCSMKPISIHDEGRPGVDGQLAIVG